MSDHNPSPQDSSSKKRPRNDDTDETLDLQELLSLNAPIHKLRLEAIFHPKFENEKSNHQIRQEMTNLVANQSGYLEVTLKHSGSLVLWSGGQRFYSKNSLFNSFTLVAEILLRQHMERAWPNEGHKQYEECSRYLEEQRLTCSFEVVTAVLGDHGDTPQRDFLILTAVADRTTERFYSTAQLVQLAQQFRLPHNDAWAFTTASSATKLFELYDQSREVGLASDTIAALCKTAQVHIASMYPHSTFQGEILEGFVVRYISYPPGLDDPSHIHEHLQNLAIQAQEILLKVPPTLPSTFDHPADSNKTSKLYNTNVRTVFKAVDGPKKGVSALTDFAKSLEEILVIVDEGKRRRVHRTKGGKHFDLPSLTRGLATNDTDDKETQRIAELLQTLSSLNKAVTYTMVQEDLPKHQQVQRILCLIHVHGDQTFLKFSQTKAPDAMNLFRGFCIELNTMDSTISSLNDTMTPMDCEEHQRDSDAPFLMLKMKFLPYMVRTFLCRNPLNILQQRGQQGYMQACRNQLDKWSISSQGKTRWIPFLEQWATYAKSRMDHYQLKGDDDDEFDLPPLNSFSYLKHLEHFREQWEKGKIEIEKEKGFRGMVCVIAPTIQSGQSGAELFAKALGCGKIMSLTEAATRCVTAGVICYDTVKDQKKKRDFLSETSDYLVLVMYGCSPAEIQAELHELSPTSIKAHIGHCRSWEKQDCYIKLNLAKISLDDLNVNTEFQQAIEKINQSAALVPDADSDSDSRPGLFVYFPGIPGCGKSSLVDSIAGELEKRLGESCSDASVRKVNVLVGDEHGKAFWSLTKATRRKDPSSITIADKNTPPPSWPIVGSTCSATSAFPVAVFPDALSLKTTRILGSRKPDGSFDPDKSHFYPFSLQYLAICLARVLLRAPNSHVGKLDSGSPKAGMLVIMFYSLYRYKSAEEIQDLIAAKLKGADAMDSLEPIVVPFLADADMDLPTELVDTLTEALQLQLGYDNDKKKVKQDDELVQEMEEKLRLSITGAQEYLLSKATTLDAARNIFMEELVKRVEIIDSKDKMNGDDGTSRIKLVSIDVPFTQVHRIINGQAATGSLSDFLRMCMEQDNEQEWWDNDHYRGERFVQKTHITMRFWQETTQREMNQQFKSLLGASVEIHATALLWDESVAALEVTIPETTMDGRAVPRSKNDFVHITVWVAKNAKASMSNQLPDRLKNGNAQRVEFVAPLTMCGSISFWDFENNPMPPDMN